MNKPTIKRLAIVFGLSVVLALAVIRTDSIGNVSFCFYSPGCQGQQPHGRITTHTYGYPLAYHEKQTFYPKNNDEHAPNYAGYAEVSSERLGISVPSIVINIIFWFALLHLISGFVPLRKHPGKPTKPQPENASGDVANSKELR